MQKKLDNEIDLIDLVKKIYNKKTLVLKISFIAGLIGILVSITKTNYYTSSTTFIPQLNSGIKSSNSSPISGLASLAGINMGGINSASEFPPSLYPSIVNGVPFKLDLLSSYINIDLDTLTINDYYTKSQRDSQNIEKNFNRNRIYSISESDELLFNKISNNLVLILNEKEGSITLSYSDKDKRVAAQIARITKDLLQDQIINFKNQSSKEVLDFTIKQYNEKKNSFELLQDQTAIFIDKNQNISSSLYQNKLNRLESDLELSRSVLLQLASQVEQAKLQLNKDTPVFTTIHPVTVPYTKSGPFRTKIVISYFMIGFILSIAYILMRDVIVSTLNHIKS
jgi:uncharacterized protein involved in exopolysaccharide biosynthesis